MGLSADILSQFAKTTTGNKKTAGENVVYGTAVEYNGEIWARLDGAEEGRLTPISTTADVKPGERVTIMIKDHQATITGNITSPSARTDDVQAVDEVTARSITTEEINAALGTIDELYADIIATESLTADQITVIDGWIEDLKGKYASFETITATDVKALNAEIDNLVANIGSFVDLEADNFSAVNATIETLRGYTADFTYVFADVLNAQKADINDLKTGKLDATWANINFAKIDVATLGELFARSGIIGELTTENGTITGTLVGVTIIGDDIKAGTLKVDNLVIKGTDGNYYKLNTNFDGIESVEPAPEEAIHGSVMVAKSITADKVSVSDLIAFGAKIGGFHIGQRSIYSGVKESVDNASTGVYIGSDGQINIGDGIGYFKFRKATTIAKLVEYNEELDAYVVTTENVDAERIDHELTISQVDNARLVELDPETGEYVQKYEAVYLGVSPEGEEIYFCDRSIYRLEISADSVVFSSTGRTAEELADLADHVKIGTYTDPNTNITKPSVELEEEGSTEKVLLTNETMVFTEGENEGTKLTKDSVTTGTLTADVEIRQRSLAWGFRANGNYGLMWRGASS